MRILDYIKRIFLAIKYPGALFHPNTFDNEHFVKYLRSRGAIIGENTRFINPTQCSIDPGRLDYIKIGNNCCLSFVTILAHDYSWYVFANAFDDVVPDSGGEVYIGNNVFVGYQACIMKNTYIGDNVIIGARSVVRGNIPSNTVWAGCPARMICSLEDFYKRKQSKKIMDAIYRREHIRKIYKRNPTIEEMGFFSFLFLERNENYYEKYLKNIEFNGVKAEKMIKNIFFQSRPFFSTFDDFLNFNPSDDN